MAEQVDETEYYGAKPVKGFDWVKASQAGLKKIEGVIAGREKERAGNVLSEQETGKALEREK